MTRKESVLDAIQRLPETMTYDDAIAAIKVLNRIERGERAANEGRVRPHEGIRVLIRTWAEK